MRIIVVGPDAAGKTTLIEGMKTHPLFKSFSFRKGSFQEAGKDPLKAFGVFVNDEGGNVVYDRWPIIDDLVYSYLLAGKESVLENEINTLREEVKKAKVFYVKAKLKVLQTRLKERGDEHIKESDLLELDGLYKGVFKKLGISPFEIDTTFLSEKETLEKVVETLKKEKRWKGIAHIVPSKGLNLVGNDPIQMTLAQLLLNDEAYRTHYLENKSGFVIMDNGAFEGEDLSNEELLKLAEVFKPDELVLKDILMGGGSSFKVTEESFNFFKKRKPEQKLMGVPQGKNMEEWKGNALKIIELGVDTIGIPRVTLRFGDLSRLEAAKFVRENSLTVDIHLLGAGEDFEEVRRVLKEVNIRSADSSLTYMISQRENRPSLASKRPSVSIDFNEEVRFAEEFLDYKKYVNENVGK